MKSRLSKSSFNIRNGSLSFNENGLEDNELDNGIHSHQYLDHKLNSLNKLDQNEAPFQFNTPPPFKFRPSNATPRSTGDDLRTPFTPLSNDYSLDSGAGKVKFSPKSNQTDQSSPHSNLLIKNLKNLNKLNSKSVVSLHGNLTGQNRCLSTPSNKYNQPGRGQVTKRKNPVNIKQILFDRLTSSSNSKSNQSIDRSSTQSINTSYLLNKSINHLNYAPSNENLDDFFEYSKLTSKLPGGVDSDQSLSQIVCVNNPQLELKLSQIKQKSKQSSQSIFDLRRNQLQFESTTSRNSSNFSFESSTTASKNSSRNSYKNSINLNNLKIRPLNEVDSSNLTNSIHLNSTTSHRLNSSTNNLHTNQLTSQPQQQQTAYTSSLSTSASSSNKNSNSSSSYSNTNKLQRVVKLKTQNATKFKQSLNHNKKLSQSLNDLQNLSLNQTDDIMNDEIGDAYQNEIRERRYIHHITEIEMDQTQIGGTLRAIYDGDEYNKFMERLDARIKGHDKDIERMCNAHYQGFIDCIHELLKVRPQAEQLKKGIIEINSEVQKSSESIQKKAEELIKFRRIHCNTEKAIEHLKICLPVLDMYSKLLGQMEDKKYYPALKTLELLESEYLPQVSVYKFAQSIKSRIPTMREEIKEASMKDLTDFLEIVRKYSVKMGEIAMRNAATQQNIDDSILNITSSSSSANHSSLDSSTQSSPSYSLNGNAGGGGLSRNKVTNTSAKSKKRKAPLPPASNYDTVSLKDKDDNLGLEKYSTSFDEETSATDIVDFSPVYRCLHIYSCLGARDHFEKYYRGERQQQAKLALQAPMNMHENIEVYKNYFCGIIGFFVIEDHILTTGNGLVTKEYLDSIWNNSLQTVLASLRTHSSYCTDVKLMLQIKKIVILFIHTLQSYGYNVNQLFNLLIEIRDQYNEILMKQWVTVFRNIFESDNYHPMVCNNVKELNDLLMEFPFYDVEAMNKIGLSKSLSDSTTNDLNQEMSDNPLSTPVKAKQFNNQDKYFKKFPFSSFVPKVFREVKQFIRACLDFSIDLNTSQTEIEDMVRKSTNLLLTRTLSGCLSALIKKPNLQLIQLVQIAINTNYLEGTSIYLEDYISKTIGYNYSNLSSTSNLNDSTGLKSNDNDDQQKQHLFRLQGKSIFKDARAEAESQIYLQLNQKIDEFFDLQSYDWNLVEPSGVASSYISDLIKFLNSTFEAFTNLPLKVAQTACHLACKHIANSLMGFLLDEKEKQISLGAISQLNLDLLQCEMFAGSEPVKGFEDGDLLICFAELRQLIDLFMEWDWSTYFADFGKQHSKYLRVKPNTALVLLEKVKEAESKKNFITSLKKNERDKKKLTDIVIKNLRQLISEQDNR